MERQDLGLYFLRRQSGGIEQPMKTDCGCKVRTAASKVECAHSAKTITGNDDLTGCNFIKSERKIEDMRQSSTKRRPIGSQPIHFAKTNIAGSATELLAEQVDNKSVIAKFCKQRTKTDLDLGYAPHVRHQDNT